MGSGKAGTLAIYLAILISISIPLSNMTSGAEISFVRNSSPVNDNADQSDLDIEVVGTGNESVVLISFVDQSYGVNSPHVSLKRSRDGGSTWDPVIDLQDNSSSGNKQVQPSIDSYSDENGTIIGIVYMDSQYRPIPGLQEYVIICAISRDNGSTWNRSFVTPLSLSGYPSNKIRNPRIKFGSEGLIFVVWEDLNGSDRIKISFSIDTGASWSTPQNVAEPFDFQNPANVQRYPDVASNGEKVFVTWQGDPDYKPCVYLSKARLPSTLNDELFFEVPWKVADPVVYPMYTLFFPVIESDGERVHLAWWDFSTDPNGNNNEDIVRDRPCIKYTSTDDSGGNWSVNGSANIIVNRTNPVVWHSQPDLSVGKGIVAVSWVDSANSSSVLASFSTDNGSHWSPPLKANGLRGSVHISDQKVSIDDGGNIHCAWFESSAGGDRDIYHSRTAENTAPTKPSESFALPVDEHGAIIMWSVNTEPDFDHYELFIGKDGLSFDTREWPEGELYATIFDQSANRIDISEELDDDTFYAWGLRAVDVNGLISEPAEGKFRTFPMNQPPSFSADLSDIQMDEDRNLLAALNLSELIVQGVVVDEGYGGIFALEFDIETNSSNKNISGSIASRNECRYLDLLITHRDWFGSEEFRLWVRDAGKDGSFYTSDDGIASSNWFNVVVSPVNDPPVFTSFMDLMTGWRSNIPPDQTLLEVPSEASGCFETFTYSFSMTGRDVDGDFIRCTIDDQRFDLRVDDTDPMQTSVISFTPENEDVPWIEIPVSVTDGKGGSNDIRLRIWVHDHDSPPFFISAGGIDVNMTGDVVRFETEEGQELTFSVEGEDIDPGEFLELRSSLEETTLDIQITGDHTWNVTVHPDWEQEEDELNFYLYLLDKAKINMAVLQVVITTRDPDPILYLPEEWLEISFVFDMSDDELGHNTDLGAEWNEPVTLEGNSVASKGIVPFWVWEIKDHEDRTVKKIEGNPITAIFLPSDGELGKVSEEAFNLVVTVSGKDVEPVRTAYLITVTSDGDDDNDGLPDSQEIIYFGDLRKGPDDDPDEDGFTNIVELMNPLGGPTDPTDPMSFPGGKYDHNGQGNGSGDGSFINISRIDPVLIMTAASIMCFSVIIIIGVFIIVKRERKKEKEEDDEIEERVSNMRRRQDEIECLYGVQKAGDAFGPDQSTLDDLVIDLGGTIYHGKENLKVERPGGFKGGEVSGGPLLEKTGEGPLFEGALDVENVTP